MFPEIYLVGGAVRDEILGIETKDLDFATPNSPEEIAETFRRAGLSVRENGRDFGTIATHIGEYDVQVTTYRSEEYAPGSRQPVVSTAADIDSDLSRRDFTINAMAISRDEFIDPYDGLADITNQIIRSVGSADAKFKEDPLRIIRAFRFVSTLGYDIEPETLEAIRASKANIYILSGERIAEEFKKMTTGAYWSDSLYEMADSGVLAFCLRNFGVTYPVTVKNVQTVLDTFSQHELTGMSPAQRWHTFFDILADAERSTGVSTINSESTINSLGIPLQLGKKLIKEILEIEERSHDQEEAEDDAGKIRRLEEEYAQLQAAHDSRAPIVGSKLASERGKQAFYERSFGQAVKHYLQSLDMIAGNHGFALQHSTDTERRSIRLNSIKRQYAEKYGYYLSAYILSEKLYQAHRTSKSLISYLQKHVRPPASGILNDKDILQAIEEAIVRIYRMKLAWDVLEPYEEFLRAPARTLDAERISHLLHQHYGEMVRDKSRSPRERGELYARLAEMAKAQSEADESEPGLEYYDPLIDSLLSFARATETLEEFNEKFDELEAATDTYMEVARRYGRERYARKRAFLNSATALVHGLSLAKKLTEKHEISRLIVASYRMAGVAYNKNAGRFSIYLEWFSFLLSLKEIDNTEKAIKQSIARIERMKSYNYVDPDEAFFRTELGEIADIRDLIQAIHDALRGLLEGRQEAKTGYKELDAALTLAGMKLLSPVDAFKIIKNRYLRDADKTIEVIPLGAVDDEVDEDVKLIQLGESETTEFKQSWRYSLHRQQGDPEISRAIMKTISAFMNTRGGKLYIGVHDDGHVTGLEEADFMIARGATPQQKIDSIRLQIDELFDKSIGSGSTSLKRVKHKRIDGKTVLIISIRPAPSPVFIKLDGKELFCVRSSASTRELSPSEMHAYFRSNDRFNSDSTKPAAAAA